MKKLISSAALVVWFCLPMQMAMAQLIVAHRGASHDAPENTMAAFNLAWEQQADGIEGDFYLSSDGYIVCIHDKTTRRTSDKNLPVSKTSFEELRSLDVGSWKDEKWKGEQIPTLEEVLDCVPSGKVIFIELKAGPKIVAPMVKVIKESKLSPKQMVIICFDKKTVVECKKQLPHLKVQWLTSYKKDSKNQWAPTADEVVKTLRSTGADLLGSKAETKHLNSAFIQRMCKAGYCDFGVWTVNNLKVAKFYKDLGAVAITTNRPGWLREQLRAKPAVIETVPADNRVPAAAIGSM